VSAFVVDLRAAPVYETEPLEGAGPGLFLNTVVAGWTVMETRALLERLNAIELELGRRRAPGGGKQPRTIDIDVLLYGARVDDDARLTLPHPRMHERAFVLAPLLDLAPTLADPRSGRPYRSWLAECAGQRVSTRAGRSF
jgi:2-amino-4-hydroxy-6-hydroxymethyldihydropteridine diphosphokinase